MVEQRFIKLAKEQWDGTGFDVYHEYMGKMPSCPKVMFWRVVYFSSFLYQYFISCTVCRYKGCDIEVDGWATPDTGGEDWYCKRCGKGGTHIYY
jgi:hypothetical protein